MCPTCVLSTACDVLNQRYNNNNNYNIIYFVHKAHIMNTEETLEEIIIIIIIIIIITEYFGQIQSYLPYCRELLFSNYQ